MVLFTELPPYCLLPRRPPRCSTSLPPRVVCVCSLSDENANWIPGPIHTPPSTDIRSCLPQRGGGPTHAAAFNAVVVAVVTFAPLCCLFSFFMVSLSVYNTLLLSLSLSLSAPHLCACTRGQVRGLSEEAAVGPETRVKRREKAYRLSHEQTSRGPREMEGKLLKMHQVQKGLPPGKLSQKMKFF